jgi:hypothetical protein
MIFRRRSHHQMCKGRATGEIGNGGTYPTRSWKPLFRISGTGAAPLRPLPALLCPACLVLSLRAAAVPGMAAAQPQGRAMEGILQPAAAGLG